MYTWTKTAAITFKQEGYQSVKAIPYDMPIVGYGNGIVNTLRIWDAEPVECFQLESFDKGRLPEGCGAGESGPEYCRGPSIPMTTIMQVRNFV